MTRADAVLPKLRVYPSVGDNPYQALLYSAFGDVVRMERLRRPQLLRRFGFVGKAEVLHFHWEDGTFWKVKSPWIVRWRTGIVLRMLNRHKASGGKIVWTVHNERPHRAGEFHEGFRTLRSWLVENADLVHVHSEAARDLLIEQWPVDPARIAVVPHSSYAGFYAPQASVVPGTKAEGVADLLFFGSLNTYKGVDALIGAVGRDGLGGAVRKLTIAGSCVASRRAELRTALADATFEADLRLGRVPDDKVAGLMNPGQFMVLPYQRTLTSGVAHLAITFGLPVIGPRLGGIAEGLPEAARDLLYDPEAPDGLADAIRRAAALSPEEYRALSAACIAHAEAIAPETQSRRLIAVMQERGIL
ncbi:glycosyltransferase family 4 protein [Oceanicola sp. 22II-s10i]|uniref:glycosyltransferase family 4 protein n=1 Tax=Oceanicola sp. 22II-s10i TaxID=1317116 RepID=UPI00159562E6|nr:glycosyltransferase family 4 protein [Oceanicola sp. 22II-s10i]